MKNEWESKYKKFFGTWEKAIEPFYNNGGLVKIQEFLRKERSESKTLLPSGNLIFRCFQETPIEEVKVILCGMSPYFTKGVPDGLSFSCGLTKFEQPSLRVLLDAVEQDLGYKDDRNPDLTRWAKMGVLMLNRSLTALPGEASVHTNIWGEFMKFLFVNVLNNKKLVVILLGKDAQELEKYCSGDNHKVLKSSHPSYFARISAPMTTKIFSQTNEILKNWQKTPISWLEHGYLPFEKLEEKQVYKEFI